ARHDPASVRTSAVRSIWSRLRFSNDTARGRTLAIVDGNQCSSTSSTAATPGAACDSVATSPGGMLAPSELVTTGPCVARAAAVNAVVVLLPLVPLTTNTGRPTVRAVRASG